MRPGGGLVGQLTGVGVVECDRRVARRAPSETCQLGRLYRSAAKDRFPGRKCRIQKNTALGAPPIELASFRLYQQEPNRRASGRGLSCEPIPESPIIPYCSPSRPAAGANRPPRVDYGRTASPRNEQTGCPDGKSAYQKEATTTIATPSRAPLTTARARAAAPRGPPT